MLLHKIRAISLECSLNRYIQALCMYVCICLVEAKVESEVDNTLIAAENQ